MANPYLNLGCGRIHLPGERPAHHDFVDAEIYAYPDWVNVDKSPDVGADKVMDLFAYPWPLESNSYDGALLSHLCEHIPHEIKIRDDEQVNNHQEIERAVNTLLPNMQSTDPLYPRHLFSNGLSNRGKELANLQDGWFAFFSELYRVLTHDAKVHIMSPHLRSDGAFIDPSHTRHLTPTSFYHSMIPQQREAAPFAYQTGGIHFEMDGPPLYRVTELFIHLQPTAEHPPEVVAARNAALQHEINTHWNVVSDFYVRLRTVKE